MKEVIRYLSDDGTELYEDKNLCIRYDIGILAAELYVEKPTDFNKVIEIVNKIKELELQLEPKASSG